MSKIEDALNKAKASRNSVTGLRVIEGADRTTSKQVVPGTSIRPVSKEIALMKEEALLTPEQLSELGVITSGMDDNALANNYRDIRTKLIHNSKGENFVVMVTSCVSDEDDSNFTLNLATAFTFDESKTSLLIDCNLRHSRLNNIFSVNQALGLTDYLKSEDVEVESIVRGVGIKRLRMIPTGTQRESATEYFTSQKMRNLMDSLISRYSDRYIFLNSAPVRDSADTRILIELCDYVILTVPYGKATPNIIKDAVEAIDRDKFLGVVFNEIPNLPNIKNTILSP